MDVRCFTCQMLYTEVCRVAHAPSSLRVRKGDRVALYMPMIPELVIAMPACARIGAVHTAIFSGYAAGGVRSRIQGARVTRWVSRPTWAWITGHACGVYGPLAPGGGAMMFDGVPTWPMPDRYWRIVEKFRVHILYTAPTVIRSRMRMGEAWPERYDLRTLRVPGSVGEPINPEVWQWYHKISAAANCHWTPDGRRKPAAP